MAVVISLINMKGGVGKTTLSIGLADCLSNMNQKVLIIDADPQFNATQALLDAYKPQSSDDQESNFYTENILSQRKTIYKLFQGVRNITEIYTSPSSSDVIVNLKKNLDILCGDLNLVLANSFSDYGYVKRIKNFIDDNQLKDIYDYIIIDCPPTITIYTNSALMASDYYLIPNRIDRYSIVGINSLQQAVDKLIHDERINLQCLGIIYTMVSPSSVKQERLKISFESTAVVNNLYIFSSKTTIQNNIQNGISGALPTKYKQASNDIEAIALELKDRINSLQKKQNENEVL